MTNRTRIPDACGVGFKEWSGVCDALAEGVQVLILRKGGIAEGQGGFQPEHPFFWLYPTQVHEAQQGLRTEAKASGTSPPAALSNAAPIRALAAVEAVRRIDREVDLDALENFHVWTPETVYRRFRHRSLGLWALVVRVWTAERPTVLVPNPEQVGCKSWIDLDPPLPTHGMAPTLDDEAWRRRLEALPAVLQ